MIIREINSSDVDQVIELLNSVFPTKHSKDWWIWKYFNNPFGDSIIFVAEINEKIVGLRSFWKWKLICRGITFSAFQPVDTVVAPHYKRKGIFTKLTIKAVESAIEKGAVCLFNFPNKNSLPGCLKLGWEYVGLDWYIAPVTFRSSWKLPFARGSRKELKCPENYQLKENALDNYNMKKTFSGTISTLKSAKFFKWRYNQHPYFDYGCFTFDFSRKKISFVFRLSRKGKARELLIVDWFGDRSLILKGLKELRKESKALGVDYIAIVITPKNPLSSYLQKSGFLKVWRTNFVVLPLRFDLEQKLLNGRYWDIHAGIVDTF